MLTLQILDREQQYLVPLTDRPLLLGSAATADLRLTSAAPEHARIVPTAQGAELHVLGSAEVRCNGVPVQRTALTLGDRIELGAAVLVVGRSVTRPKRPEDVLAAAPRLPRTRRRNSRAARWLPLCAAALAALAIAWLALQTDGPRTPTEIVELDRLRRAGSFDLARAQLARLEASWRDADEKRRALLADTAARIAELEAAVEHRRIALLAAAREHSYAELNLELQREERSGQDETTRLAARIVRGSLSELLQQAERPRIDAPQPVAPKVATADPPPRPATGAAAPAPVTVEATLPSDLAPVLQDVDRLAARGLFAQGLSVLDSALASAGAADAERLDERRRELQRAATVAHDALVAAARATAAGGALDRAIADLANAEHQFPGGAAFAGIGVALAELRAQQADRDRQARPRPGVAEVAAVDEATRRVTLEQVRSLLDRIRSHETSGDFAAAATAMREGAELVARRDPDYATRLLQRAEECDQLAALQQHAGALFEGGRTIEVPLRSGRLGVLHGTAGHLLRAKTSDGEVEVSWLDVGADGLAAITATGRLPGAAVLGAAALLYRLGEAAAAEALLAKLHRSEPKARPAIERAIARGRGEPWDERGYVLGKDGFVAARTIEAQKEAQKLLAKLDSVLRSRDPKARQAFLTEALAQGPQALEPVVLAFRRELQQRVDQLGKSSLKKQLDRLAAQRTLLDEARNAAKELIYDEARYFYPYKPPQVSSERFAEYNRVQAEVDRRVEAVRSLWRDDRARVRVPASLRADLDRLDWVAGVLADLGELDAEVLADVAWARALPPGEAVTIATYCATVAERDELALWQRIEAFNRAIEGAIDVVEREQLRITNDYRAMFRHRPLALNLAIRTAARGHAEEMSKLGYFAHFSPTPGRRTPFDRMQLAGYPFGVSENIALSDSAANAHAAWCRSSGHHRNLLNPAHTEFGVGGLGRYWVQNFGRGKLYEQDPAWLEGGR